MESRILSNILYKTVPAGVAKNALDGALCADVYLPSQGELPSQGKLPSAGNGPFPAVFYWHGGGWMHGDRTLPQFLHPFVEALSQKGVAFVSLSYRLASLPGSEGAGNVIFPMPVHDTVDGLRFFLQNADDYQLDKTRFALFGVSAGAHLALMAGLAGAQFGEALPRFDYQPSCLLDYCGPTDFNSRETVAAQAESAACFEALLGASRANDPAACYLASPAAYACATPYLPPILAVQGQADELVHRTQPETLQKIYESRGASFSLLKVENGSHAFGPVPSLPAPTPSYEEILAASLRFLFSHLL